VLECRCRANGSCRWTRGSLADTRPKKSLPAAPGRRRRSGSSKMVFADTNRKWASVRKCARFSVTSCRNCIFCGEFTRRGKDNMKCGGAGATGKQGCMSCSLPQCIWMGIPLHQRAATTIAKFARDKVFYCFERDIKKWAVEANRKAARGNVLRLKRS
jgi:hypothetical protein